LTTRSREQSEGERGGIADGDRAPPPQSVWQQGLKWLEHRQDVLAGESDGTGTGRDLVQLGCSLRSHPSSIERLFA
jgi:hypothetical protein